MKKNTRFRGQKKLWFNTSIEEIFLNLNTSYGGISNEEYKERIEMYGENKLPSKKETTMLKIFIRQFLNPLIYILIAASIVAVILNEFIDAIFIFAVIFLNASLGTFQEWKAEKSANELQKMLKTNVRIKRNNVEQEISSEYLVPGDIILLESGQKVPADIRLFFTNRLSVDEAFLTGESEAVEKSSEIIEKEVDIHGQKNILFAGSTILTGRGSGIVVETGMNTAVGEIAESLLFEVGMKPPLVIRMEKFTRYIGYIVLCIIIVLALVAISMGMEYQDVFFISIALAVSAIPEGLPIAVTVALSIATNRMAKRNVIVRQLPAVESLGSCTLIASDKTGTLTVNRQTLKKLTLMSNKEFEISGEGYEPTGSIGYHNNNGKQISASEKNIINKIAEAGSICNEAFLKNEEDKWKYQGDAIDIAFLTFAYKIDKNNENLRERTKITGEIPFESEKRFTATRYVYSDNLQRIVVKGAMEKVINFCTKMITEQGIVPLDNVFIEQKALEVSQNGYRVLAIALKDNIKHTDEKELEEKDLNNLALLGLVGFIDPIRPESKEAVKKAKLAGITVIMITGDHPATALSIAKDLEIADSNERILTGDQIKQYESELSEKDFNQMLGTVKVFARVTPLQKLTIIETMLRLGHFVAVTGDGVNDAPALKKANIGVAMGSGSDIAKDTASILIVDDKFSSIVKGIEEGRFAYSNIRKVIYLLIATGAAEIVLFILSLLVGLPIPLYPAQLLWLNLVTNGIQDVALAFEGGEPGEMNKPPRNPKEGIFNELMIKQTLISGMVMGGLAFGIWYYLVNNINMNLDYARNIVLLFMVLLENVHVFNCRSETISAFKVPLSRNYILIFGVIIAQIIHISCMYIPFMQKVIRTNPVSFKEWLYLFGISLGLLVVMELFKKIRKSNVMRIV